jgi:hypothetical protein
VRTLGSRAGRVWGDRSRCAIKRCDVCLHLRRRWRAADAPDPITDTKTVMLADDTLAVGTTLEAVEEQEENGKLREQVHV